MHSNSLAKLLGCAQVLATVLASPLSAAADRSMVTPVATLYKNFGWQALSGSSTLFGGPVEDQGRKVLANYFDAQMTDLLLEDAACKQREGMCHIESDILFDSQDPRVTDLEITSAGKDTVAVHYKDPVTDEVIAMRFAMRRQAGMWRIKDIIYLRRGRSSLREMLSVQEAKPRK